MSRSSSVKCSGAGLFLSLSLPLALFALRRCAAKRCVALVVLPKCQRGTHGCARYWISFHSIVIGLWWVPSRARSWPLSAYLVCGSLPWHARHRKCAFSLMSRNAVRSVCLLIPSCQQANAVLVDSTAFHAAQVVLTSCLRCTPRTYEGALVNGSNVCHDDAVGQKQGSHR
jgi:hypothetical protein